MPEKYRLVEVDLARHVRDVGYWHLPYGTPLGKARPKGYEAGHKHTRMESRSTHVKISSTSDAEKTAVELRSVDWQSVASKAMSGSGTEREKALQEFEAHYEKVKALHETMTSKMEVERTSMSMQASRSPIDRTALRLKSAVSGSEPVAKAQEFTGEVANHTFEKVLTANVIKLGTTALGGFASLLTGAEAAHFSEQFRAIAENPLADSTIAVLATTAVFALFNLVRKKLKARKALKVAKAQGRA